MAIYQIAAIGIVAAVLSLTLKKDAPAFSALIGIAATVLIFVIALPGLSGVIDLITNIAASVDTGIPFITPIMKIIGIAYIAEFSSQLAADAGESAIAAKIELAGKIMIMTVSAPIVLALVEQVANLIK